MRLLIALVLFAAIAPSASAKCGFRFFVVSGVVLDAAGSPVSGALVGASWTEHSTPTGPAMTTTGPDGRYSIPIRVDTYSGSSLLTGDKCQGQLKQVSVSAHSATHRSAFTLVPVTRSEINIEPLHIDTPIQREPLWPDEVEG